MNLQKAILYIAIMLLIPFIGSFIFLNNLSESFEAFYMSVFATLYINGPIATIGVLIEASKLNQEAYKKNEKVFLFEWVETTFSLWILAVILIVAVKIFLQFR